MNCEYLDENGRPCIYEANHAGPHRIVLETKWYDYDANEVPPPQEAE